MHSNFHILLFSIILACTTGKSAASDAGSLASAYGISFGPNIISASRYNASGHVEVTEFPGGREYLSHLQNALQDCGIVNDRYDPSRFEGPAYEAAKSVFEKALQPLMKSLHEQLGHEPEVSSIITASIMSDWLRDAAKSSIFPNDPGRTWMQGTSQKAATQAYGFLECNYLDRSSEECHDDGPQNSILLLEFEHDYLYAWVKDVEFGIGTLAEFHHEICKDCGERFRKDAGDDVYEARIKHFIMGLVETIDSKEWHSLSDLRALVIAGEGSLTGAQRLAEITKNIIGIPSLEYITDLEPSQVIPHGAAAWARLTKVSPERFITDSGNPPPGYVREHAHDEL